MDIEMSEDVRRLLSGDAEAREFVYHFFETDEVARALLKGEDGVSHYEQIIEIAEKAGAPLEEVRNRFIPLLDQDRFQEHTRKLVEGFIKSGAFADGLRKVADAKKAEVDELRRRHEEAVVIIEKEMKKRKS